MVRSMSSGGRQTDPRLRWIVAAVLVTLLLVPRFRQWLAEFSAPVASSDTDRSRPETPRSAGVSDPAPHSEKVTVPRGRFDVGAHPPVDRHPSDPPRQKTTEAAPPGKLTEIRPGVLQSAAGLLYVSGSSDGHRLKHVLQHAADLPDRKVHGVFDGDQDTIVAVIDEAFVRSREDGSDVRRQPQGARTVLTVRFHRRIGYVGGEEGKRHGHPECRFLRIVLERDNVVVTAYPTRSF